MVESGRLIQIAAKLLTPKMGYRHLFVYGPYLDEDLLRERCPDPEFVALAVLTPYSADRWRAWRWSGSISLIGFAVGVLL
jgi:hypothetical protein